MHISGGWANTAGGGIAPQENGGRGGNAEDNHLIVSGGTVRIAVGGVSQRSKALRNAVDVSGGTVHVVYGGSGRQTDGNRVAISGGNVTGAVIGGFSGIGSATNNSVALTGGSVRGDVYSGRSLLGSAEGNVVTLDGVHIMQGNVYGGYGARGSKNIVNLKNGAEVDGMIFGGFSGGNRENNNLLAIHGVGTAKAEKRIYVQHLDFYLDPMASPASPTRLQLRTMTQSLSGVSVGVGVKGHALVLRPGDTVSLLRVAPGGTLNITGMAREAETMHGVSVSYAFNGVWMEAVLHGGSTKANYHGQVYASQLTTYRYTAPYWAVQLGVGKTRPVGSAAQLDCYARYFWSHTNGVSARLNTGETYDFHATDSHRLRAGARYTRFGSASALYAGLALEYEMAGGATAHFQSYDMPASSATGASVFMELGWRSTPKHGRVTCEVNLSGWQGHRSGWMGSARMDWKF